ncbi:MAG: DUF1080 domain-containing protein, partial [Phycisphaerae bacterium]|nr:DUF1080 domain-containing protein [Phycisphaerae bacterium]
RVQLSLDRRNAAAFPLVEGPIVVEAIGWLVLAEETRATFRLTSDDGSRLRIDGKILIDHDGRHGASSLSSGEVTLGPGAHPLWVDYFDGGGQRTLVLEWKRAGATEFEVIGAGHLRCETDPTRVTGPGTKRITDEAKPARRPGDGRPLEALHPAFVLTPARPEEVHPKVGSMCFLPDGRLVIGVFDPLQRDEERLPDIESKVPDRLLAIEGLGGPQSALKVRPIADGVYEPSGLCAVGEDLYVSHRLAITRLRDLDHDGWYEDHLDVARGWEGWNYHQFTFGLVHVPGPSGSLGTLYATLSTAMAPPAWEGMGTNAAPNGVGRGTIIAVDLDSQEWRVIAGGVRTPNGIGRGPGGTIVYCDNQGTWFPTSTLSIVEEGRFFGHFNNTNHVPKLAERFPLGGAASVFSDRPRAPATVYLPHNECANSPTQPLLVPSGPWKDQLLVGDVTAGGLHRIALERVGGSWQGVVLRCSQGLECGSNRLAWGPDGALYFGGIGAQGNWNWKGTQYGLQRLAPTGDEAFEMLDVHAIDGGFEVRFTKPVDPASLTATGRIECSSWRYEPTAAYGGPKIGERSLPITRIEPSADGRSVRIFCDGLAAGTCVHLHVDPTSASGEPIWSTDAWYTLNACVTSRPGVVDDGHIGLGAVPPARAMPLVGRSADGILFEPGKRGASATAPRSQQELMKLPGTLRIDAGSAFATRTLHRTFRLHAEWQAEGAGGTLGLGEALAQPLQATDGAWHALDIWAGRASGANEMHSIRVVLDGTPMATLTSPDVSGPLPIVLKALEGHGSITFRNVWIAPLDEPRFAPGPWTSLATDPAGEAWEVRGGRGQYRLEQTPEGDEIIGTSVANSPNTFLATRKRYGDFELLVDVRQDVELNSGIQVRSVLDGGPGKREGKLIGYQVELDPSDRSYTGGIYDEARRDWLVPLIDMPYARQAYRKGEWNRIHILAEGPVIRTWVNGIPAAVLVDEVDRDGVIGLQVHGVGDRSDPLTVRWRNLRIRELTPAAPGAAPTP